MKRTLLFLVFTAILSSFTVIGQTTTTLSCDMPFTDTGGPNGNYANNETQLYEVCPTSPDQYMTVSFSSFNLENNFDFLKIYINGVLFNTYTGSAGPANISTSEPGQCILFEFTSDSSVNASGWTATITCGTTPPPNTSICFPPTSIGVTGVSTNPNGSSATITMNGIGTGTQWEYIAQLASLPAPTANSVGTPFTNNPFTVTGLAINNIYRFYVRTNCGNGLFSTWVASSTLTIGTPGTTTCTGPSGVVATGTYDGVSNTGTIMVTVTSSNPANQYLIVPQGTAAPTSNTTGISSTNNFTLSNIQPGAYTIYVRNDCGNGVFSSWVASNLVTISAPVAPPVCGGLFFDNGGPNINYSNNSDSVTTICPSNPGDVVTVSFLWFNTEANWDALYVHNGNTIAAPLFASSNNVGNVPGGLPGGYWGTTIPGPFTSTAPDGCLTFRFRSDSSVNFTGWEANITCGPAPTCPAPNAAAATSISYTSAVVGWTSNSSATQWEVITQLASAPAPTASSTGIIVTVNPYVVTNLNASTAYRTYIRNVCSMTDTSAWTSVNYTTLGCGNQLQTYTTQITQTSANVIIGGSLTIGNVVEVIVQPSTTAAPTNTSTGIIATANGNLITGLTCGTAYVIYTRTSCNNGAIVGSWVSSATFTTMQCTLSTGQANNMVQCNSSGLNCFTLTNNDAPILAGLNPTEYNIAYYLTTANAANQTNPLASPFCVDPGTFTIIARLTNIATQEAQYFTFTITSQNTNPVIVLAPLSACDDNSDGQVVFNLTNLVNSSNPLNYYQSATNASAQVNPITNPNVYTVGIANATVTVFIRETMTTGCDNLYSVVLNVNSNCNVSNTCINAYSLCGALGTPFNNTHQNIQAEVGNNYGCLNTTPNPSWFYLPISANGTINLTVQQNTTINFQGQNLDVDYVVYGPFTDPVSPCTTPFTANQIVSCSYSSSATEFPVIANAVAGQYYLIMTTNFSNQAGFIKITLNSASQGAIDCTGIRMNAFLDTNNNGTQEITESNFPLGNFNYTVNNGVAHNVTSPNGTYSIYDTNANNQYDLSYTINPSYAAMYALTTNSYTNVNIISGAGLITYNFPITILQSYNDVAIFIIPENAPRAGTTYRNKIVYTNLGNQSIASGVVNYSKDAATTITNISQSGTVPTATGFNYTYSDLLPFETRSITVSLSVPTIPTVSIGQLLTNMATITPDTNEAVLNNNTSTSTQAVIAAYDPNDKTEAHGDKILFSAFAANEYFYYTIRFENLGNASAINVTITDELDAQIDENSVEMVSASHNYTLDRVVTALSWRFNNIQLPVSVANTDIGKGYVTFRARLKPGFAVGDIVPNTASIFFDSNPPVITNTFNSEFVEALSNASFHATIFTVFPNPANQSVQITLSDDGTGIATITLYDVLGKMIKTVPVNGVTTTTLDISNLPKGLYLLTLETTDHIKVVKKLIIE